MRLSPWAMLTMTKLCQFLSKPSFGNRSGDFFKLWQNVQNLEHKLENDENSQ